jgi:glycerol dehydrogenase
MAITLICPSRYVQGRGALKELGSYAAKLGKKCLCLISEGGIKRSGEVIRNSFDGCGASVEFEKFGGECSRAEIDRLVKLMKDRGFDVVIGVGGGKIFDTAKAVAFYTKTPVAVCPTVASTDAPCSALSVIYTEEGAFAEYLFLPANPNLVLMDTEVIAKSPVRLTVSGMGDAMATYFEARACIRSASGNFAGGTSGITSYAIARACYETLLADGLKAKTALEAHALTPSVERIIEANTLMSGVGFESCGVAAAHAIHNGLTVLPECHHMQHGEKVNFGTLSQLVMENIPKDELADMLRWMTDVGLPVTFADLGITDTSREHLMPAAEAACAPNDTIHNMPFSVDPEMVYNAMLAADAYGRKFKGTPEA